MRNMPPKRTKAAVENITKLERNVPETRRILDICEFGKQMQNFHKIQFENQMKGDKRKFHQDCVEEIIEELHLAGLRKDQVFREKMIKDIGLEPIQDYKYHKLIDFDNLEQQFKLERPASASSIISTSQTQTQPQNCPRISPSLNNAKPPKKIVPLMPRPLTELGHISQQKKANKRRNLTPIDQQQENQPAKILRTPTSQDLENLEFNVTRTDQRTQKSRILTFLKNSIIQKATTYPNNF